MFLSGKCDYVPPALPQTPLPKVMESHGSFYTLAEYEVLGSRERVCDKDNLSNVLTEQHTMP